MGQISAQIAASLPAGVLQCDSPVSGIDGTTVYTPSGRFTSERVVLACGPRVEAHLLGRAPAKTDARPWRGVTNLAFALPAAKLPSVAKGVLVLDGDAWRIGARVDATPRVINLAFMSSVSEAYAPAGYHLASLTMLGVQRLGDEALAEAALAQMRAWFGAGATDGWTLLKVSRIAEALPDQSPPWLTGPTWPQQVSDTIYRCGDHTDTASIDGAIVSGLRVAGMVRGMEK
jgi:phytoene dehydrogenase-like protein